MPAATGAVYFLFSGQSLQFTGLAYHDKNWRDVPFADAVNCWYWGHGTLGKFSVRGSTRSTSESRVCQWICCEHVDREGCGLDVLNTDRPA